MIVIGEHPLRARAVNSQALLGSQQAYLLGVAHQECADAAIAALQAGKVALGRDLPLLQAVELEELEERLDLPPSGKSCAFCYTGRQLTDEHVWPQWLSLAIAETFRTDPGRRSFVMHGQNTRKARRVIEVVAPICHDCNTRWMSTLETDAKSLVTDLATGKPRELDAADQQLLATWAVKTALMFDLSSGPEAVVPLGAYRHFAMKRRPLDGMWVIVGACVPTRPATGQRQPIWIDIPETEHPNVVALTLTAGCLMLQVIAHFVVSGTFHDNREHSRATERIWPPAKPKISWPPEEWFDWQAVQAYAASFENRPAR